MLYYSLYKECNILFWFPLTLGHVCTHTQHGTYSHKYTQIHIIGLSVLIKKQLPVLVIWFSIAFTRNSNYIWLIFDIASYLYLIQYKSQLPVILFEYILINIDTYLKWYNYYDQLGIEIKNKFDINKACINKASYKQVLGGFSHVMCYVTLS